MRDPNATGTTTAYRCSKCGQLKKNHRCTWVAPPEPPPLPTPLPTPGGAEGSADADGTDDRRKPERVGWKPEEDEMIKMSVAELGHKWFQIAERLPGRTDHAIRNRWHRLLTMRLDEMHMRKHGGGDASADVDYSIGNSGGLSPLSASLQPGLDGAMMGEGMSLETLEELTNDPIAALDLRALVADPE